MSVFFKALILKLMQLLLTIVMMRFFAVDEGKDGYWDGLCRLVFCLVAHLMMQPEIDTGFDRLKFVSRVMTGTHPDDVPIEWNADYRTALNAIGPVCDAKPGLMTSADLPLRAFAGRFHQNR